MPQKIIVLIGKKGSGKSTIAGIIKKLKNNCEIKSFAEPIKNICSILGIKNENLYDPLKKEIKFEDGIFIGESGRTMMQKIGTIFRNNFDKNIFVKIMIEKIKELLDEEKMIIIDDCRFPNEIEELKKVFNNNIIFIKIEKKILGNDKIDDKKEIDNHESELFIDELKYDILIENILDSSKKFDDNIKKLNEIIKLII